ncbi:MAG: tripartite tricarboxylate transporter TctB family protein [Lachnospiraceae bacterium]|nr:tripartite tricarboxylate transporter TctB family protein [Lachnospiraceae bacterium]
MNKLVKALNRKLVLRQSLVDIILGGFICLLNLFLATIGTSRYIQEGYGNKYGVTPQTFPRAVFIAATVLGLLVVLKGVRELIKKKEDEPTVQFHLVSLAIFVDMLLFVVLLRPLGYPIANMLMMIAMYWLSGGKKWWKAVVLALAFTVVSILFFHTYLKLSIPMGLLSWLIV